MTDLACFHRKCHADPCIVLFRVSCCTNEWSVLQVREDAKVELQRGARILDRVANEIFQSSSGWVTWIPRLKDSSCS